MERWRRSERESTQLLIHFKVSDSVKESGGEGAEWGAVLVPFTKGMRDAKMGGLSV